MDFKSIKQTAKNLLHDNWASTIIINFTILSVILFFYLIDVIIYRIMLREGVLMVTDFDVFKYNPMLLILNIARIIIGFMVLSPLISGNVYWFTHCIRKQKPLISEMFIYFTSYRLYFKSILINLIIILKSSIFIFPICVCVYWQKSITDFCLNRASENSFFIIILICSFIFTICLIICEIIFISRYALAAYILAINTDLKCNQIVKLSVSLMRGKEKYYFKFIFSFLWLLPLVVFIIPVFYFLPYYLYAYTGFMDVLMDREQIFDNYRSYENR